MDEEIPQAEAQDTAKCARVASNATFCRACTGALRIASTCYQHSLFRANIVYNSRKRIYGFDIDFPVEQLCVNNGFQDSNGCLLSNQNIDLTFSFREAPFHVHVLSHFSAREVVFEKLEDLLLINRPSRLRFLAIVQRPVAIAGFSTIVNRPARKVREIARALQVSQPYAALVRSGRRSPHPRHWQALANLVGIQGGW